MEVQQNCFSSAEVRDFKSQMFSTLFEGFAPVSIFHPAGENHGTKESQVSD